MKVCYVTHKSNLTGANRSLLDLLDGLDRNEVEPLVLVGRPGPLLKELKQRRFSYRYAFIPPTLNSDRWILNALKTILNTDPVNRLAVWTCKRVYRRFCPDLVHNNTMLCSVGMQAALEMKIPYVCHFREFVWEDHHRRWLRPDRVESLIYNASETLSISDAVKEKLKQYSRKEVHVLHDGVHTENYRIEPRTRFTSNDVHLLLAGRIIEGKGQLEAVQGVYLAGQRTDRNLVLHIVGSVGDSAYYETLCEYIKKHDMDNVSIEPFVSDLRELRSRCDIGLTCSLFEGLGRVTIESMLSCMLPIVTDTAGSAEIVEDHVTGLLYRSGDPDDLAEQILWAIDHPEESNDLIRHAQDYAVKHFDYKYYSAQLTELYRSVLLSS